jgi:hypothetical protein
LRFALYLVDANGDKVLTNEWTVYDYGNGVEVHFGERGYAAFPNISIEKFREELVRAENNKCQIFDLTLPFE